MRLYINHAPIYKPFAYIWTMRLYINHAPIYKPRACIWTMRLQSYSITSARAAAGLSWARWSASPAREARSHTKLPCRAPRRRPSRHGSPYIYDMSVDIEHAPVSTYTKHALLPTCMEHACIDINKTCACRTSRRMLHRSRTIRRRHAAYT